MGAMCEIPQDVYESKNEARSHKMVCKYGDPICPCQDGDPCHYEPHGDTPAMHVSPECVRNAIRDAVAAEREDCAVIAEGLKIQIGDGPQRPADGDWIADEIRTRK